jgi:hypothetical protein
MSLVHEILCLSRLSLVHEILLCEWTLTVHEGEVSCMEVNLVLLHEAPRYNDVLCVGENTTEHVVL